MDVGLKYSLFLGTRPEEVLHGDFQEKDDQEVTGDGTSRDGVMIILSRE